MITKTKNKPPIKVGKKELREVIFIACKIARMHQRDFLMDHRTIMTPEQVADTERSNQIYTALIDDYHAQIKKEEDE